MLAIRKQTASRRRLNSAAQTPKNPVCWRGSLCPTLRFNRWLRKPLRPGSVETSIPVAVAATGSSGCSIPTAKTTSSRSRASSRAEACSPYTPPRAGSGCQLPDGTIPPLRQLRLHRCHLSVHRKAGVAEQSIRGGKWRYPRYSRQADSRHSAASDQKWRRLLDHAGVETRHRRHLGQQSMVCGRRRQPEPQACRLLGREPAWLVSAHQGAADLRGYKQPVQSQIRDFRDLLRSAVDGRDRDTERAVRPPHGYAGAAALGLCGDACEAVSATARPLSSC